MVFPHRNYSAKSIAPERTSEWLRTNVPMGPDYRFTVSITRPPLAEQLPTHLVCP